MLLHVASLAVLLTVTLATSSCQPAPAPAASSRDAHMSASTPPFTVLLSASTSGFDEPAELVLRDEKGLAAAWRTATSGIAGNPAPSVDLRREMIVVLAIGPRRTGGFTVEMSAVSTGPSGAVVRYSITTPGPGCMTTQMMTSPVLVVRMPRVDGAVTFERREITSTC